MESFVQLMNNLFSPQENKDFNYPRTGSSSAGPAYPKKVLDPFSVIKEQLPDEEFIIVDGPSVSKNDYEDLDDYLHLSTKVCIREQTSEISYLKRVQKGKNNATSES